MREFKQKWAGCIAAASLMMGTPALANGFGDSTPWGFNTSVDRANAAVVQDTVRKQKSGFYAAPTYTTNIDRQYNCNLTASATGNNGSNTTVAHSPTTNGAVADATGNASTTTTDGFGGGLSSAGVNGTQANSGTVRSGVVGSTGSSVNGNSRQALNSTQGNSGAQGASVGGSTACSFGALN
jgi:hypothetical protein